MRACVRAMKKNKSTSAVGFWLSAVLLEASELLLLLLLNVAAVVDNITRSLGNTFIIIVDTDWPCRCDLSYHGGLAVYLFRCFPLPHTGLYF